MPHGADTQHGTKRIMQWNIILLALVLVPFKHFKILFFILKNYFYSWYLFYNCCMCHSVAVWCLPAVNHHLSYHSSFYPVCVRWFPSHTSVAYWVLTVCFRNTEHKLCQLWVWVHISALASTFKWQWILQLNWKQGHSEGFFPPYTLTSSIKSQMQSWKFLLVS